MLSSVFEQLTGPTIKWEAPPKEEFLPTTQLNATKELLREGLLWDQFKGQVTEIREKKDTQKLQSMLNSTVRFLGDCFDMMDREPSLNQQYPCLESTLWHYPELRAVPGITVSTYMLQDGNSFMTYLSKPSSSIVDIFTYNLLKEEKAHVQRTCLEITKPTNNLRSISGIAETWTNTNGWQHRVESAVMERFEKYDGFTRKRSSTIRTRGWEKTGQKRASNLYPEDSTYILCQIVKETALYLSPIYLTLLKKHRR